MSPPLRGPDEDPHSLSAAGLERGSDAGGMVRLLRLGGTIAPIADDARFLQAPLPVLIHIFAAFVYSVIGAFQFDDRLRARHPAWHRRVGWVTAVAGGLAALSGIWMTLRYAIPLAMQGPLLAVARLFVGVAMASSLGLCDRGDHASGCAPPPSLHDPGLCSRCRRRHAGTAPWDPRDLCRREVTGLLRDGLMIAAWGLNLAIAEAILARRSGSSRRTRSQPHDPQASSVACWLVGAHHRHRRRKERVLHDSQAAQTARGPDCAPASAAPPRPRLGRLSQPGMQQTHSQPTGNQRARDVLAIDADDSLGADLVLLKQALGGATAAGTRGGIDPRQGGQRRHIQRRGLDFQPRRRGDVDLKLRDFNRAQIRLGLTGFVARSQRPGCHPADRPRSG